MQLPTHWFLKNNHVAALNYAMPRITHYVLLPYELPASEVYISFFAMFLYILNIVLSMIIFFQILAFVTSFPSLYLSLGLEMRSLAQALAP